MGQSKTTTGSVSLDNQEKVLKSYRHCRREFDVNPNNSQLAKLTKLSVQQVATARKILVADGDMEASPHGPSKPLKKQKDGSATVIQHAVKKPGIKKIDMSQLLGADLKVFATAAPSVGKPIKIHTASKVPQTRPWVDGGPGSVNEARQALCQARARIEHELACVNSAIAALDAPKGTTIVPGVTTEVIFSE